MEEKFEFLLYGQIYGNSGRVYAYPISNIEYNQKGIPPWMNKIPADSRFIRSISMEDCYSIRLGEEGFSYAYTFTPGSSRDDKVMLVLHVGKAVITDASELIKIFKCLSDYIVNCSLVEEIRNDDLRDILNPLSSILRPVVLNTTPHVTTKDAVVYYTSDTELVKLLQDVAQRDYQSYNWIHLVNSEYKKTINETDKYSLFPFAQVKKCYFYETPRATTGNDVIIGVIPNFAAEGEEIEITYAKSNGFIFKTTARVGYASEYISEGLGNVRSIKDARSINIKFTKEIPVRVYDENNKAIEEFSIDGMNNGQNKVIYIEENQTKTIIVRATGYLAKQIKVSANQDKVTVALQSNSFEKTETAEDNYFHFPKISFIVSCILLILIVGFVCFFSGKLYQQHNSNQEIQQYINKIDSLNTLNKNYQDTLSTQTKKIQRLQSERPQLQPPTTTTPTGNTYSIDKLNEKAFDYLNKNDDWCLRDMKTAASNDKNVSQTASYKFLVNVLEGTNLNDIVNFKDIDNNTWTGIKECISNLQTTYGKTDDDILDAFAKSTQGQPNARPTDKTMSLSSLSNNLSNLSK